MKYLVTPWAHQLKSIEKAATMPNYALFFEMGCLSRDTKIKANINGCSREYTIEEFYRKWNKVELSERENGFSGVARIRAWKEDHVGLHKIVGVIRSGEKEVYALKVKGQPRLKLTKDHRILTKRGWVEAGDLLEDDQIACDRTTKHQKKKTKVQGRKPRYNYLQIGKHHPYGHNTTGYKGKSIRRIEKHRAIYEANLNKKTLVEFQEATKNKLAASKLEFVDPGKYHIHHVDHDHKNNDVSNLAKLSAKDHLSMHSKGYVNFSHGTLSWARMESFKKVGVEMTYDISCASPYHNFVANGIVVHNCGKTATAINILRKKYYEHGRILRTLVLCPPVVRTNWKREFAMHASGKVAKHSVVLEGSGVKRAATFDKHAFSPLEGKLNAIFITNYESLTMEKLWRLLKLWGPEAIVFDESHKLKNYKTKRTKLATELADQAACKLILTGTPILNSPMDIWSQYRILDGGETFDRNFFAFRARYFVDRNAGMPKQKYFPDWRPIQGLGGILHAKIYKKAARVLKSECLDLPPLVRKRIEVEMSADQKKLYTDMAKSYIAYLNDKACVATIALTRGLRLQQIISGFFVDDEDNTHEFRSNQRLDTLIDLVEQLVDEHKIIIWASFKVNYTQIAAKLKALFEKNRKTYEICQLTGGMTDKARQTSIDKFQEDHTHRVMIANQQAGGVGVNLTAASYALYYSRSFSLEADLQSEARNHRGGSQQHKSITRVDLVVKDTIDDVILGALARKENLANDILRLRELL